MDLAALDKQRPRQRTGVFSCVTRVRLLQAALVSVAYLKMVLD